MLKWIRSLFKKDKPKYARGRTTVSFSEDGSIIHFVPSIIDGEDILVGYAYDDWALCELDLFSDAILSMLKREALEMKMPLLYYYRDSAGTTAKLYSLRELKK